MSSFDSIDHKILVALLERKIDDKRFIKLIKGMLAAGYVEDWQFHRTHSGTPQGGVISPLLANVYLHELDEFVAEQITAFNRGARRMTGRDYQRYSSRIHQRRRKVDALTRANGSPDTINALRVEIRQLDLARSKHPSRHEMDPGFRRLLYCGYADDFVLGVIGSKHDAETIQHAVQDFLRRALALDVAEEKSGVHHASDGVEFLGYRVRAGASAPAGDRHSGSRWPVATSPRAPSPRASNSASPSTRSERSTDARATGISTRCSQRTAGS